ncbi:DUF371 domain-containing protein [Natrialbaceae archaeon AArc-T1-2]|uniref:DUF371 domain-containing protein n=1 Tax=Natrialbaceae archaeon AArc-T1-2 TaxID=3053904 RepID=UPI00255A8054|nr:DUF371 domain-containing protein [Natrialbaceae archaeon AArc-T1-2]WIV66059.1 DUF371 domain-containing protein [Natrialbaceae archaeon AArc-T1-2]
MALEEVIHARGHEHISADHASTFEVTTDDYLTPAGDCILAICADRAPADFDPAFVEACRDPEATITMTIAADGYEETVTGRGDPDLEFASERSAVGRTSEYVDDRTVMLEAAFAAEGFDRDLVDALADGAEATIRLAVSSVRDDSRPE